jgi:hypothetical protein
MPHSASFNIRAQEEEGSGLLLIRPTLPLTIVVEASYMMHDVETTWVYITVCYPNGQTVTQGSFAITSSSPWVQEETGRGYVTVPRAGFYLVQVRISRRVTTKVRISQATDQFSSIMNNIGLGIVVFSILLGVCYGCIQARQRRN